MPRLSQRNTEQNSALAALRDALSIADLDAAADACVRLGREGSILNTRDYDDIVTSIESVFGRSQPDGTRSNPTSTGPVEAAKIETMRTRNPR